MARKVGEFRRVRRTRSEGLFLGTARAIALVWNELDGEVAEAGFFSPQRDVGRAKRVLIRPNASIYEM